jgi:hypothetical protein
VLKNSCVSRQFRRISALAAAAAWFVACSLNPGVDLPKSASNTGDGGTGAISAGGSSGTSQSGGSSGSAGTEPGTGGSLPSSGSGAGGSGGTIPGAAGAPDDGTAGAPDETEPYANVTGVTTSGSDGAYTFNVSVESSDIDCTEFANWWEVLAEDGTLVYRRILEHSHTDENGSSDADAPGNTFTRSGGPVPIAAGDTVLVRAHMSTGGYRGMVMRGRVTDGFADALDIGGDFAAEVESEDPQPTGCDF